MPIVAEGRFIAAMIRWLSFTNIRSTTEWILYKSQTGGHYNGIIMSAMASQIISVSIVCSNVCSGADLRKHQSSVSLDYEAKTVDSPHSNAENVSIWWRHHGVHEDVKTWKSFPHGSSFYWESIGHRWLGQQWANNAGIWCSLYCYSEQAVKLVILYLIANLQIPEDLRQRYAPVTSL